jgi:hypothetical protein
VTFVVAAWLGPCAPVLSPRLAVAVTVVGGFVVREDPARGLVVGETRDEDPWGRPVAIEERAVPGPTGPTGALVLRSDGPDGRANTSDDVLLEGPWWSVAGSAAWTAPVWGLLVAVALAWLGVAARGRRTPGESLARELGTSAALGLPPAALLLVAAAVPITVLDPLVRPDLDELLAAGAPSMLGAPPWLAVLGTYAALATSLLFAWRRRARDASDAGA